MLDRSRWTLARLMGLIAGVALACALGRTVGGAAAAVLVAMGCVVEGVAWVGRLSRRRAALLVGAAYPWVVVATVLALGLRPGPGLQYRFATLADRADLALWFYQALIWGTLLVAVATAGLVLGEVHRVAGEPESPRAAGVMLVMAGVLASWGAAFVAAIIAIRQ